ncbi:hypothetical protein H1S01_15790 [Heliobacterium chlorum]|uniref:Uncharacterized protein n=1 Tax=Heliobacterium chlorum TaxID=2698 RepID=A0ABR7T765_HELCL|nr:three component ABC system middle component [Heliobacterium chlorum]MBC9785947.1 hypothetical protein [Heliobacterium chlorum]
MLNKRSVVNNEFIGALSIYYVLIHLKEISVSKAMLILPFVAHKGTVDFLKNKNTIINSLEELMVKKPTFFSNYNQRYYSFLPITFNSIALLLEIKLVRLYKNKIIISKNVPMPSSSSNIGVRAYNIIQSSFKLAHVLRDEEINLYLQLRVQI